MSGASGGKNVPPDIQKTAAKGAWGSTHPRGGPGKSSPSYSSITSINTSVRDNKNILEVKLEKQEGSRFNMTQEETENLLKRLNIDSSHLIGASACPEGRPVVLITLHPTVDLTRFLYRNESYIVKEGVRTTTIRPEGKKEKLIKITGLHPNTKDQAVIKYLTVHATVSPNAKVIHHVFPGELGSSLLAGKLNGNRSYMVELKMPMGSYHIIDGEKVSVRYSGQEWTCARCHQYKKDCPGAAVARECTADRVMLSTHMMEHWQKIGYEPDTDTLNGVDEGSDLAVQVGSQNKETNSIPDNTLSSKYHSAIVRGFRTETSMENILEILSQHGLPADFDSESFVQNDLTGSITLENLKPEECLALISNMNKKMFLSRQIFVTSVVSNSPVKAPAHSQPGANGETSLSESGSSPAPDLHLEAHLPPNLDQQLLLKPTPSPNLNPDSPVSPGVQDKINQIEMQASSTSLTITRVDKRKSESSPESSELSRKEKKMLREEERKQDKMRKKLEFKEKNSVQVQINHSY